ncbi:putative DNA endonuclease SmrA [Legionella massiliensis]|uniref:Putative DNA endonuclease SmrA n=1 Tax=Legionella massiliensis TaxID=1034943 RepID=A0A078KT55_9GAMM|nr:Smr/MutS family protein [Legionella massiliensis]CDZ77645.1 putative DNA endonuclease SmrA [Legionella massiliensis]CEE13383.1 putative DNA endonuclease SmrA [Legionella massiliensis]
MRYTWKYSRFITTTCMSDDSLSDEDKSLFRQMMTGVKPLTKSKKADLPSPKTAPIRRARRENQTKVPPTHEIYLSDYYTEEVQTNSILSYCSQSIPNKRLRELKNGLIPWQARLDLHGLRPDAARQSLVNFLQQQTSLAHRCLLVIHGKGSHKGEAPVLKNLVAHWLPQFPQVLAFHSALNRDGGAGAVYVLLKRQKEE